MDKGKRVRERVRGVKEKQPRMIPEKRPQRIFPKAKSGPGWRKIKITKNINKTQNN